MLLTYSAQGSIGEEAYSQQMGTENKTDTQTTEMTTSTTVGRWECET